MTPWTRAHQAPLSSTASRSLVKVMLVASRNRIQPQSVSRHPSSNHLQALTQELHRLHCFRFEREVELGIIRLLMNTQPKPPDDLSQRLHVDVEKHGGEDRTLRYPTSESPGV
ncbi:Hypothetical predicted protein [Podarcis lilfordi]|uniref:Uncharacterized protein n=1 Tax=Podarcis lilfordi TaxID=74358 RepID=A0AA35L4M4_9SAUR|nr:Hypothetical predicted protein [Podarcis lilfordi]